MKTIRAIIVDDEIDFLTEVKKRLEGIGVHVDETTDSEEAKTFDADADILIIDSLKGTSSYWQHLLGPMRRKHPSAQIILVTQFEDNHVTRWIDEQLPTDLEGMASEAVLTSDPLIDFVPKEANNPTQHFNAIKNLVEDLKKTIEKRRLLESVLLTCVFEAGRGLLNEKIENLIADVTDYSEKPTGAYRMDVIAEQVIHRYFRPYVHSCNILICTEEAGVQNALHHRVLTPQFFIFSDPLDGSSRFKSFIRRLISDDPREMSRT